MRCLFYKFRALPSTSIKPNEIVIDRSRQSVNMEIDSSSESEIDMETVKRSVDCKGRGRESEIDLRAQDTRAPIDSSSESDLDITVKDGESAGVADVEPHSEVVTDKQRETKTTQKRTSRDKLRQKKLKQKVFLKIMSIYL